MMDNMTPEGVEHPNLEQVYDEQIYPLMAQIIAICQKHGMPHLAYFQYEYSEDKGGFGRCITADGSYPYTDDHLIKLVKAARNGFPASVMAMTVTKE